jgi:hypothetical protein
MCRRGLVENDSGVNLPHGPSRLGTPMVCLSSLTMLNTVTEFVGHDWHLICSELSFISLRIRCLEMSSIFT